ncbi:unnamed protein product [Phaedon cochleariae]|nr:unnamed protein product [Phaedon cochleariae]
MAWLSFYDKCFEDITEEFVLIPNGDLVYNNPVYPADMMKPILSELNLSDLKTCFVRHCPNAFGVSLVDKHGIKLTYSGDTMPADSLIELGANSDVLIHEATMEDELAQEAVVKMHSTTSQAIEVGRKMAAKHVILTHFSQRYAKLPRYNDNFSENVGIAFDNMQVNMNDLVLVPHLRPALKLMFAEHYEDIENKAMKRNMRLEREKSALSDKNLKRKQSVT